MPDYLPHTNEEVAQMLSFIGLRSLDELYNSVPALIERLSPQAIAPGLPEPDVLARMVRRGKANIARNDGLICFAGAGSYDHEVPPVVRALSSRSEFVTSYTPYQAEVAQGVLQMLFEFQTMIARLSGLPIANASLYDGASALAEAVHLGVSVTDKGVIWCSSGVHPHWRSVLRTIAQGPNYTVTTVPLKDGKTDWQAFDGSPGVVVVANPNYQGYLEEVSAARSLCDATGALLVVVMDPISAALVRSGGEDGADVVIGEGQPFGAGLSFGGPYLGLFSCREEHVRRLPGRLVGQTTDNQDRRAFVTTLRTREQDIRRERATSNVCTNQTLLAVTAAIQLSWLGTEGIKQVALRSASATHYLGDRLGDVKGVSIPNRDTPWVREFIYRTDVDARQVIDHMANCGFLGGVALKTLCRPDDPSIDSDLYEHGIVVAATERRTRSEIDGYVDALKGVMQ